MKRTITINISGRLFNIDEDAFEMLNDYQTTLRHVFSRQPDGLETLADLESRISEIFGEQNTPQHSISKQEVENLINRIGRPEEMGIEPTQEAAPPKPRKRLFRDPADKKVAGVCAGIAAYFNADPLWIRLATIVLFLFLNGAISLVYLALWIFLPVASTPADRMQMVGASPTLDNIASSVTDRYRPNIPQLSDYTGFEKICSYINSFCAQAFKVLLVFYGLVALLTLFWGIILTFASGYSVFNLLSGSTTYFEIIKGIDLQAQYRDLFLNYNFALPFFISLAGIAFSTVVGISAVLIMFFNTIFEKPLLFNRATRITFTAAFIIGIIVAFVGGCITFANNIDLINYID